MANEINNISAAGVCIEIGVDDGGAVPIPVLISSWGFRDDTLQRQDVGIYTMELTRPQSGVISEKGFFIEQASYVFLATFVLTPPPGFVTLQLTNIDFGPNTPPAGTPVQLTHLLAIPLDDPATVSDAVQAVVSAEVRQVPQQD